MAGKYAYLQAGSVCPLQAQCIIFRRYPEVLAPFKYAGYPMLLQAVTLPTDDAVADSEQHFLAPDRVSQLQARFSASHCSVALAVRNLNPKGWKELGHEFVLALAPRTHCSVNMAHLTLRLLHESIINF